MSPEDARLSGAPGCDVGHVLVFAYSLTLSNELDR
jgi:hypothetical protein